MNKIMSLSIIAEFVIIFLLPVNAFSQSYDFNFAGYPWKIKTTRAAAAPGPSLFSKDAVSIDEQGILLKIKNVEGDWICAEVFCQARFGYGTYRFTVDSRWEDFPDQAVLGLFTWSNQPEYYNREIDIEVSRWNGANPALGQFTVQPHSMEENKQRFQMPRKGEAVLSFQWEPEAVHFSAAGSGINTDWSYRGEIPPPGSEKVHINLWLYRGAVPDNGISVLVKDFSFTPYSSSGADTGSVKGGTE